MSSASRGRSSGVAKARNAASVILLRDSAAGPEVFMVERHAKSRFVGGAHVFPGGRVDPEDSEAGEICVGLDDAAASRRLHLERGGLAYYVAAVRECFEEAGVLLAYGPDGDFVDPAEVGSADHLEELRSALNSSRIRFLDLAAEEGWRLATDRMHYWAHWITPEASPIRFDTRFFLAVAPAAQTAIHDDAELTGSEWITPREAIAKAESGEWTVIFPTLRNLMTLRDFGSAAAAEEAGRRRGEVETMHPAVLRRPGGIQVVLPGDEGYEEALEQAAQLRSGEQAAADR